MTEQIADKEKKFSTAQLPKAFKVSIGVFEIAAVVILAFIGSKIVSHMITDPMRVSTTVIPVATANNDKATTSDFKTVMSFDAFFGGLASSDTVRTANMPESTIDLKIFGLRSAGNGHGTAILKPQGEVQKLYRVGENITGNIRLSAVYPDHIEINRNGQIEIIYLNKDRRIASSSHNVNTDTNDIAASSSNIDTVIDGLDLEAFRKNNRITGFVIGNDANDVMLQMAGLQKGDILNSVNGETLHSWERISEISSNTSTGSLEIILERHGASMSVSLPGTMLGQ
ncbi:type II secretion system protein N [Pseudemcibacter aquimaris]|uniref:type II secretion system protein N n=1 Tax=Pseudemcibacter aquimaris TaxID=2857064 RepID=UPI002013973B|nr:type II secretion system protein N [Pseudemcibacter aquimaris]MCC3861763.1 hypothetical protein [Pseudemcibacter aquimaris]WDU58529.1 hypothetical protein KW060_15175 [Pseudemcibacter aquimaris]